MTSAAELKSASGIIYVIRNFVTGHAYVGKTVGTFNKRYSGGNWWKYTGNTALKDDVARYGLQSFSVELLHRGVSRKELVDLELQCITSLGSMHPNGYNKVWCSSQGELEMSEETKRRMSKSKTGIKPSPETCERIRQAKLGTKASEETKALLSLLHSGDKHHNYGKSPKTELDKGHSPETRRKISTSRKARGNTTPVHAVQLLNESTRDVIREFDSPERAAEALNVSVENVYSCCRHKRGQIWAGGHMFVYKTQPEKRARSVRQLDFSSGAVVAEFPSIAEARRSIGLKGAQNIRFVCEGKRFTCGGFKWEYINEAA